MGACAKPLRRIARSPEMVYVAFGSTECSWYACDQPPESATSMTSCLPPNTLHLTIALCT